MTTASSAISRRSSHAGDGSTVCPRCGGSGMLRLGDQSFRTCLECLGQGHLPGVEPATTTAAVLHPSTQPIRDAASSVAR